MNPAQGQAQGGWSYANGGDRENDVECNCAALDEGAKLQRSIAVEEPAKDLDFEVEAAAEPGQEVERKGLAAVDLEVAAKPEAETGGRKGSHKKKRRDGAKGKENAVKNKHPDET